jgi:hypothetical protein
MAWKVAHFWEKVKDAARKKAVHPLDIVYLDAGHPWKTNPADIAVTLQETGFEWPQLYQRQQHLSRPAALGEGRFKAELAFGKALHALLFGWPRCLSKALLPEKPQRIFSTDLLAAERRV